MGARLAILLGLLGAAPSSSEERALRAWVAQTALEQVRTPDAKWDAAQRDCAGLLRFAYRTAFRKLHPERVERGLWKGDKGEPTHFADAETLLSRSFVPLGRGAAASSSVLTADVLAFRQMSPKGPVFHLMLAIKPRERSDEELHVIYHPGPPATDVRLSSVRALVREAPVEWWPVAENPAFLGFFRFKEWSHD